MAKYKYMVHQGGFGGSGKVEEVVRDIPEGEEVPEGATLVEEPKADKKAPKDTA